LGFVLEFFQCGSDFQEHRISVAKGSDPSDCGWLQWNEFLLGIFENPFSLLVVMARRVPSAEGGRQ